MLREITLGQYYPVSSPIHSLDPRTKLLGTLVFLISLFVTKSAAGYLVATVFLSFVILLSRVPFRFITKGLRAILFVLVISVSFNIFLTDGTPVFVLGPLKATREGLSLAAFMGIRLIYLVIGSSVLTLTTTPNALTNGLETSLSFLNKIHVPVHEIAMMMSIALRFIPILTEEADKIMKAQTARGADFSEGGLIHKAKALIPLLVPLFISAFRRASDLAMAMEARCYHGGEGRTRMKPLRYKKCDVAAFAVMAVYMAIMIAL